VDEAAKRRHFAQASLPAEQLQALTAGLPDRMANFRQLSAGGGLVYVLPPAGLEREVAVQPVDIFSADGRYLYRAELKLPGDVRFSPDGIGIAGDSLYALCRDPEGRHSLCRFAIAIPPVKQGGGQHGEQ
jgi:hypothetical protein